MDSDILIIAATNCPFDLDDAALRWFTRRIYVGMPDMEAWKAIIEHTLKDEEVKLASMTKICEYLEGYSASDITAICKEAAMGPVKEHPVQKIVTLKRQDLRAIQDKDFYDAIKKIKPSYSSAKVKKFIDWERSLTV